MKKNLIALILASIAASAQPLLHPPAVASYREAMQAMPLPPTLTATLPDDVRSAATAAQTGLEYRTATEQTLYYTAQGEHSAQPVADGYSRKILGQTADGRTVVQDYQQGRAQALTAPYALQANTDPTRFRTPGVDSKIVHYRADGSVASIVDIKGGRMMSRINYYEDGKLVAQSPRPRSVSEAQDPYAALGYLADAMRAYYPDGRLMAVALNRGGRYFCLMYRPDGTPLAAMASENNQKNKDIYTLFWNRDGQRTTETDTAPEERQQVEAVATRLKHIGALMAGENTDGDNNRDASDSQPRLFRQH